MKIAIGSDHAGYELKEALTGRLTDRAIPFQDFGVTSSERADYPDIALSVSQGVARGEFDRGILVCGSGIGMSIAANKVPGIRAALCGSTYCARMSREHNNANVLVLGGRVTGVEIGLDILDTWLDTEFPADDRHSRRIEKMAEIEKSYMLGGR